METDDVRVIAVGTALWLAAFVALLPFYDRLTTAGRAWWLWTCLAGFGLGLFGVHYCRRRRDSSAAARAEAEEAARLETAARAAAEAPPTGRRRRAAAPPPVEPGPGEGPQPPARRSRRGTDSRRSR